MTLALNTDILTSRQSPQKYLRLISEAGFTHLHWCHQWNTDFLYGSAEISQIREWLKSYQLKLLDIHGSSGVEKCYFSTEEYQRKAGVELVLNRIRMLRELDGTGSVMMHIPVDKSIGQSPEEKKLAARQLDSLRKSLDELLPALEKYQTKIAVENTRNDSFKIIAAIMQEYPAQYFGITLDTGHANIEEAKGLDRMEEYTDRLEALHLNDNDCSGDLHQPPFLGNLDWERIARMLANSHYPDTCRPLSFELAMRNTPYWTAELEAADQPEEKIKDFLADTMSRCQRVEQLYQQALAARQ